MADPFSTAPTSSSNPFTGLADSVSANPSNMSPQLIDRTARMGVIAQTPTDALVGQYSDLVSKYSDDIQKSGDDLLRTQVATQQQADSLRSITKMQDQLGPTQDPGLASGLRIAADNTLNEDIQRRKEYALEQTAFEKIQNFAAAGDVTQAKILMDNIRNGGSEDVIRDINVKRQIINREVEKAGIAEADQPWFKHATDFIASTVGDITFKSSFDRGNNLDIDKSMTHWWDWIVSGNRQRAEAAELWKQNPADFAKAVREQIIPRIQQHASTFGYSNQSEALNLLTGFQNTDSPWKTNLGDATNVVGLLPFASIAKVAEIPYMMIRAGARKEAADAIAGATLDAIRRGPKVAEAASGISQDELVNNITPSAINPVHDPIATVPLTGDVLTGIERGQALMAKVGELQQSGRMTEDEYQTAITTEQERITQEFGRPLKDFTTKAVKLLDGSEVYQHEFLFGKKNGGGFISSDAARNNGYAFGVKDPVTVQDESGQWFVKETRNLNEAGFYTTNLNPGLAKTGIAGRLFLGSRQVDDEFLASQTRASANSQNKMLRNLHDSYGEQIKGLGGQERDYLANAMSWGENKGVWLQPNELEELFARQGATKPPSAKVHEVYNASRDLNDIEFALRNDVEYKREITRGAETVSFQNAGVKVDRENAIVNRNPTSKPGGRVYNVSDGVHYNDKSNPLTQDKLDGLRDDGYVLVSLKNEQGLADKTTVKHFIMKKSDLQAEPLRRDQLPYRAGGHRMYADKYFVKQAVYRSQPDTGEKFLRSPNTYVSGTKAEMEKYADVMEQARTHYNVTKGKVNPTILDDILSPLGHMDTDGFTKAVKDGLIETKTPFQAMADRQLPKDYLQATSSLDFVDLEEGGFTGWLRTNGRMYYSAKGEQLKNWQGELARTVDPFETINSSLNNIANLTSFSDYKLNAVERWVNTYEEYLDIAHLIGGDNASNLTKFAEAKYRTNVDKMPMGGDRIKNQMEAQRDIIRKNLGWRTDLDRQMDQYAQRAYDYILGDDPENFQHTGGRDLIEWWATKNPLNAMRGLAFDMKMGFFNIAQFPLQIQTMLASAALGGWDHAGGAFVNLPFLRHYLTKGGSEHSLDLAVERGMHTVNGMEAAEYKAMMRSAKQSGFFDFGGTHQLINSNGPNATVGGFRDGWDKFSRAGRFAFNEGEVWNRITAWQLAWKEISRTMQFPTTFKEDSVNRVYQDFRRRVALKADDYSMSMMAQSQAMWQSGIASIPTQFWAYNARMLEAMLGKQFTSAQKMRLFISQTLFYGVAGAPVVGALSDVYKNHQGHALPLDSVAGMMDRGLLDEFIYHTTGANVLAGKRYSTGTWANDLIGELFGLSPYGEKSFADVVGGATYSIMKNTYSTLADVTKYVASESGAQDQPLIKEQWLKAAQNVSTASYAMKAYMAYNYHAYYSSKGTVAIDNLPTSDAMFMALGIAPGETGDIAAMSQFTKDRKKSVDEVAKFINNHRARMAIEPDNRDEIGAEINAMSHMVKPDIWSAALKKAHSNTPKTLFQSLTEQVEKDKAQREMLNAYGKTN